MSFATTDLCDRFSNKENFQIAEPIFRHFGKKTCFSGQITTLKVFEDNSSLKEILTENVSNRVLVVDGGGSKRCALLDSHLATLASGNGWQGIIIYGCIRDTVLINNLPIGIMALNTHPLKSRKHDHGIRDSMITFAGVNFKKDHFLYADCDGIIVSETKLD